MSTTKTKADRRADVLKFIAANPGVPVAAGVNMGKGGRNDRFHASTLRSMEKDGVLTGYLGNDGDRWYRLAASKTAGQQLQAVSPFKIGDRVRVRGTAHPDKPGRFSSLHDDGKDVFEGTISESPMGVCWALCFDDGEPFGLPFGDAGLELVRAGVTLSSGRSVGHKRYGQAWEVFVVGGGDDLTEDEWLEYCDIAAQRVRR
jgi:hypothetical protein